jgi:hypothetical protein
VICGSDCLTMTRSRSFPLRLVLSVFSVADSGRDGVAAVLSVFFCLKLICTPYETRHQLIEMYTIFSFSFFTS